MLLQEIIQITKYILINQIHAWARFLRGFLVEYTLAMAYLALEILVHGVNVQRRGKVHLKILNG